MDQIQPAAMVAGVHKSTAQNPQLEKDGTCTNDAHSTPSVDEMSLGSMATRMLQDGVCPSCVLRYSSHRYQESYKDPAAALRGPFFKIDEQSDGVSALASSSACIVCLGVLQHVSRSEFVNEVCDSIKKEQRKFSTFSLSTVLPNQIVIRSRCYWEHLKTAYPQKFGTQLYDVAVPLIKDVLKWGFLDRLIKTIGVPYAVDGMMDITMEFRHGATDHEWEFLKQMDPDRFQPRKRQRGGRRKNFHHEPKEVKPTAGLLIASLDQYSSKLHSYASCPPAPVAELCNFPIVRCAHVPVFVAGRYLKYSRQLSQTPWLIDGERKGDSSVEELLTQEMKQAFKSEEVKFSASGREDIDVRMLGTGRPFIVELMDPKIESLSTESVRSIQDEVNSAPANKPEPRVQVRDLQIVQKVDTSILKEGEEAKTKTYMCVIWLSKDLDENEFPMLTDKKNIVLQQTTPIRVMHRRNVAVREKTVHWCKMSKISANFYRLWLNTEAGTYVKEFVHGDFGRTLPNVGSIFGCEADILSLDVIEVGLAWPAFIDPVPDKSC